MKLLSAIVTIAISMALIGCGGSHHDSSGSESGINITPDQLSTVIDPVCKMSLENSAIADTTLYKGKIYGFCNVGCKEAFLEEPEKYLEL